MVSVGVLECSSYYMQFLTGYKETAFLIMGMVEREVGKVNQNLAPDAGYSKVILSWKVNSFVSPVSTWVYRLGKRMDTD